MATSAAQCHYIFSPRKQELALNQAGNWLFDNARAAGGAGWIAVNDPSDFDVYGRKWPGCEDLAGLFNKYRTTTVQGVALTSITPLEIPSDGQNRPLLVLRPVNESYLDELAKLPNISKMLVCFGHFKMQGWIEKNKAVSLGDF